MHGIELLCIPAELTDEERAALVGRFPVAAEALAAIERHDHGIEIDLGRLSVGPPPLNHAEVLTT